MVHEKGEIKIADFGVATQLEGKSNMSIVGSPLWMSPEVISGSPYDRSDDIWSVGVTAIEIAEGNPPHIEDNVMRVSFVSYYY